MSKFLLLIDEMGQGGAERQISYLAMGLKKAGHEVRLIKFYDGHNYYGKDLENAGVVTETFLDGQSGLKRVGVIRKLVRDWKPDLTKCYTEGTCTAACLARLSGLRNFRFVVSERNTTQRLTFKERLRFWLYRAATAIVPNSYSQEKFIRENFPGLSGKVKVITNMVDTVKFSPAEHKPQNDILQVITTARVAPQKNALTYVDGVAELKKRGVKVHLNWFGNPYPDYFEKVKARIAELDIADMVTFNKGTDDVVTAYRNADIFLLPSLYEGFPNVLCEAMACGLPAIATAVCDSPVILTDERWHVDPHSPQSFADAIERMVSLSPEQRAEIGRSNRQRIVDLCSENKFIENNINLLNI